MTAAQQRARAQIIFNGVALDGPTATGIERFRVIRGTPGRCAASRSETTSTEPAVLRCPLLRRLLGKQPSYSYCGWKLRTARWIWFGRDPIRSIMISTSALRT